LVITNCFKNNYLFGRGRLTTAIFFLFLVFWPVGAASTAPEAQEKEVFIGVLAKRGAEHALKKWGPTADYLTRQIPGYSFKIQPLDFRSIYPAVAQGQVEFVLANSSFYVELEALYGVQRITTLRNRVGHSVSSVFGGVIFVRSDNDDIRMLEDLKGKSFMGVDEESLGGFRMAWGELAKHDIDPYEDFSSLGFGGTHDAVVYAVWDQKVDAGTVRSDTLERMAAEGKISLSQFRVINLQTPATDSGFQFLRSTPLYPEWPFASLASTPIDLTKAVTVALLNMPEDSPAALASKSAGWTVPHNYQPVHDLLKQLQVGIYHSFGKVTLGDVLRIYWYWILLGFMALIGMAGVTTHVSGLNTKLRSSRFDLQEARDKLEVRVRERTQELEQASKEKRLLLDSAGEGIFGIDSNGQVKFINRVALEMLGWENHEHELLGFGMHELTHHTKPDGSHYPREECPVHSSLRSRETNRITNEVFWRKDGGSIPVEYTSTPILEDDGNAIGAVVVFKDITERKQAEQLLINARREAESASKAKGEFLAVMSHEIRTPMNGVLGMAELLRDSGLDEEQNEYVEIISDSGKALLEIIDSILDLSKIEAEKLELEPIPFDLERAAGDVIRLLSTQAEDKGLDLDLCYGPECPRHFIGDAGRVRQVLMNLVGNAIKFTEQGFVRILISCSSRDEEHGDVRIEVQDTGIGIAPENRALLFTEFTQADASTTRRFGGTGLGLAICRQLVGLMEGEIGVDSTLGSGSTFWLNLTLPYAPEPEPLYLAELQGVRVLLLDNDAVNRRALSGQLKQMGIEVAAVESIGQAVTALQSQERDNRFQLLLLDRHVDGISGKQLAQSIRAVEGGTDLPLVLLTSTAERGDAEYYQKAGFAGYLAKPVSSEILGQTLSGVLGARREGRQPLFITRHQLEESSRQEIREAYSFQGHVLLAEDNMANQVVAVSMLKKLGLRTTVALDGIQVMTEFARVNYDLILMDCQMPKMDGYEATEKIRKMENNERIPIVALTANVLEGDREKCLAAGMDDFLAKPLKREELVAVLDRWLPLESRESEAKEQQK
jgi:phosphate/phosphite/phosphonate ABC transporter binding protein